MKYKEKILKNPITYLVIIILIQLISIISIGLEKESFHIDEIYSYILSNSYDADRIANDSNAWGKWLDGKYFEKFISVQEDENFTYDKVNSNNSTDAHPPLYYFLLHTICSFFPNIFTKWFGLILNCAFFVGIQIILFILVKKITKSDLWGIASVAFYGGMFASLDMIIFIRMYPMLTFFAILLIYLHYLLYLNQDKKILYFSCAIITFLGIYTQYYFAFLACCLAIIMCIIFLKNKKYKKLITYALLMLLAVAMVFIIYPAAITQITGSETNNIGNEVVGNILNFSKLPSAIIDLSTQIIKGIVKTFYENKILTALAIVLTLVIAKLLKNKKDDEDKKEDVNIISLLIIIAIIITFIVVVVSHISGKFTYLRYVYYIYPLISIFVILLIKYISSKMNLNSNVIIIGVVCTSLIGTITCKSMDLSTYLFKEKNENNKKIELISNDKPVILMNNGTTYQPTANFEILLNSSQVYLYDINKEKDVDSVLEEVNIQEGIMIIVLTDKYWSNGYDGDVLMNEIIEESEKLTNYEEVGTCEFSNIYIAK